MEGFTVIDGVVAVVIVLSALLAYSRGVVREGMAILGWVAAAILGFMFGPQLRPLMTEIPVIGEFMSGSCELSVIGGFAAVFTIALVIMSFFTPLFSTIVQRSALGGVDQALGFLFGVARGVLLIAVAFFVYDVVISAQEIAMIDDSRSAVVFSRFTDQIEQQNPEQALGWITAQYEALVSVCEAPTPEDA